MEKQIKDMPHKEAWEKLQKDYFLAIGYMYRYMKDEYSDEEVFKYLREVEVPRFKRYYQTFATKLANILEKVAPGQVFERKMVEITKEFQFFIGVGNVEIIELDSEKAKIRVKECPYAKANADGPKDMKVPREVYCKFQCNGYMKDICTNVMNIGISFEPREIGCIYNIKRV